MTRRGKSMNIYLSWGTAWAPLVSQPIMIHPAMFTFFCLIELMYFTLSCIMNRVQSNCMWWDWFFVNDFLFQRSSSECHSYFFIWEGLPLFSGRKQRLMVESISWNLDSLNNCSVEHLKYTKIPGLVWAMEEVYAATYWFDTCVSARCAAPLLSVLVEKPHNCKCDVTARSSCHCVHSGTGAVLLNLDSERSFNISRYVPLLNL